MTGHRETRLHGKRSGGGVGTDKLNKYLEELMRAEAASSQRNQELLSDINQISNNAQKLQHQTDHLRNVRNEYESRFYKNYPAWSPKLTNGGGPASPYPQRLFGMKNVTYSTPLTKERDIPPFSVSESSCQGKLFVEGESEYPSSRRGSGTRLATPIEWDDEEMQIQYKEFIKKKMERWRDVPTIPEDLNSTFYRTNDQVIELLQDRITKCEYHLRDLGTLPGNEKELSHNLNLGFETSRRALREIETECDRLKNDYLSKFSTPLKDRGSSTPEKETRFQLDRSLSPKSTVFPLARDYLGARTEYPSTSDYLTDKLKRKDNPPHVAPIQSTGEPTLSAKETFSPIRISPLDNRKSTPRHNVPTTSSPQHLHNISGDKSMGGYSSESNSSIRIIPQLLGLSPEGKLVLVPMTDPVRESLCAHDVPSMNTSLLAETRSSPVGENEDDRRKKNVPLNVDSSVLVDKQNLEELEEQIRNSAGDLFRSSRGDRVDRVERNVAERNELHDVHEQNASSLNDGNRVSVTSKLDLIDHNPSMAQVNQEPTSPTSADRVNPAQLGSRHYDEPATSQSRKSINEPSLKSEQIIDAEAGRSFSSRERTPLSAGHKSSRSEDFLGDKVDQEPGIKEDKGSNSRHSRVDLSKDADLVSRQSLRADVSKDADQKSRHSLKNDFSDGENIPSPFSGDNVSQELEQISRHSLKSKSLRDVDVIDNSPHSLKSELSKGKDRISNRDAHPRSLTADLSENVEEFPQNSLVAKDSTKDLNKIATTPEVDKDVLKDKLPSSNDFKKLEEQTPHEEENDQLDNSMFSGFSENGSEFNLPSGGVTPRAGGEEEGGGGEVVDAGSLMEEEVLSFLLDKLTSRVQDDESEEILVLSLEYDASVLEAIIGSLKGEGDLHQFDASQICMVYRYRLQQFMRGKEHPFLLQPVDTTNNFEGHLRDCIEPLYFNIWDPLFALLSTVMKEFEFDPLQVAGLFAAALVPHDHEAMNQLRISLGGILQGMISDDHFSKHLEDSEQSFQQGDDEEMSENLLLTNNVSQPLNRSAITLTEEFIRTGGGSLDGSMNTPPLSFADNDPLPNGGGDLSQTLSLEYSRRLGDMSKERNIRRFGHDVEEESKGIGGSADDADGKDISLDLGSVSLDLSGNEEASGGVDLDLDISAGVQDADQTNLANNEEIEGRKSNSLDFRSLSRNRSYSEGSDDSFDSDGLPVSRPVSKSPGGDDNSKPQNISVSNKEDQTDDLKDEGEQGPNALPATPDLMKSQGSVDFSLHDEDRKVLAEDEEDEEDLDDLIGRGIRKSSRPASQMSGEEARVNSALSNRSEPSDNTNKVKLKKPGFWENSESESEADIQHVSKEATLKSKGDDVDDDDFDFEFYD